MDREQTQTPLVDVGWIVAGAMDSADRTAVEQARSAVLRFFRDRLPEFKWRMTLLERPELSLEPRAESVSLLSAALVERNIRHWDFSIVITQSDLVSYYKPDAIATLSRSMEGAVVSTRRIDPKATSQPPSGEHRVRRMALRIESLVIHMFGHFCGLEHDRRPENFMFDFQTEEDLDRAESLEISQIEELRRDLREVADSRLEERSANQSISTLAFYAKATWINRRDILESIYEAAPWQFPYRLSRLTTAAVSTMMILLITAEAWDLGMSQTPSFVTLLSILSILFTGCYTLFRQKLIVRRERAKLSEQNVVTTMSTLAIVFSGIATTYLLLFALTFTMANVFFTPTLVRNWSESIASPLTTGHYLVLTAFVASLGIFIGSLGASFEQQHYFRHVTFVDEEI